MSKNAGELLWRRRHITLAPGVQVVDTGLTQVNRSFAGMSLNEPPLGVTIAPPGPADGALPASRVQVIPMSPYIPTWNDITHGEPFVDPATGTVKVTFNNATPGSPPPSVTVNVLFWDPHAIAGPGDATTYNSGA
jgi:hypothetical protein